MENDFEKFVRDWYEMPPERTDDSFYFDGNDYITHKSKGQINPEWFRVMLYQFIKGEDDSNLVRFRKLLAEGDKKYCLLRLGIKYDETNTPFFEPFLQVTAKSGPSTPIHENECFALRAVNHLTEENLQSEPYYWIGSTKQKPFLSSHPIPKKLLRQFQNSWLVTSPTDTADHFKVIEAKKPRSNSVNDFLPTIGVVKFYIYNTRHNLGDRIKDIRNIQVSMGLNLNKQASDEPTFAPILIFTLNSGTNEGDEVYEELAGPCPPTCGEDD